MGDGCSMKEGAQSDVPAEEISQDSVEVDVAEDDGLDGQEVEESSSLLHQKDEEDDDLHEVVTSQSPLEPCEDHPLRALSCTSISCVSETSSTPEVTVPDVYVSVNNGRDLNNINRNRNAENHARPHHGSECVPLRAIFNSDSPDAQNHWGDELGYKNWLAHLGRRRRCEILILVGFLAWIAFFLVLAICLNGSAGKGTSTDDAENPWKSNSDDFPNSVNQSTLSPKGVLNITKLKPPTVAEESYTTRVPLRPAESAEATSKENFGNENNVGETETAAGEKATTLAPDFDSHVTQTSSSVTKVHSTTITEGLEAKELSFEQTKSTIVSMTGNLSFPETFVNDLDKADAVNEQDIMTTTVTKANYLIGVGRADITGPAADVNMMGYANPSQVSGGIHLRQYSRAFIIEDPKNKIRTAFVNIDACMSSTLVKLEVLKALKSEFGDLYTAENLCISGTHTHSAPAGFLQDVLFQISSLGYVDETLAAMVHGIVESIKMAHGAMQPGYILMNKGELVGSNINRSPIAYENNPTDEKARYKLNVDTEMILLKFLDENDAGIGMINWFPVHCTSMNNTNSLISSDNKGYAELLFEGMMDPDALTGTGDFVAAFAQANEGDVSPNTKGPHCIDTGEPCDNIHSTCNGKSQMCVATGPGRDMFESTKIIGKNQFEKAWELYKAATIKLEGPVRFVHQYINMTEYEVVLNETTKVKTCKPAMGFSFAAGTTDGPGAFNFKQGDKSGNTFWQIVRNFLHPPTEEQKDCHFPKPILLDTGEMESPYEWQPEIVDTQILQIGQFIILALPGEFSTMAGRRVRDGVLETLKSLNRDKQYEVTLAGLANAYSDYITTFEEYQVQRYEGASTIYGPHTARAYEQQYEKLVKSLINGINPNSSVEPRNNKDNLYSFLPGVIMDRSGFWKNFGDVHEDVKESYVTGEDVSVKFVAANPRNSLKVRPDNMTFITVEKLMPDGSWRTIHTDADWETRFQWIRTSTISATSDVIVTWETNENTETGKYRITHHGYYKYFSGTIYPYSGKSSEFVIKKDRN